MLTYHTATTLDGFIADPDDSLEWLFRQQQGDVRFASGDVRAVHEAMTAAAGTKGLWLVGGGDLAGQFAEAGLLDEVVVSIAPVTLGAGRPLLPRRLDLELVEAAANGSFVSARYRVAGPLLEDRAG